MAAAAPRVFNIPSGIPFARALCEGVAARHGGDPLRLAGALILVPTRRAARALRDGFAEALGGAALLPRIRALGDIGEEDSLFDPSTDDLSGPPAIAPLRRRLLLATLVLRWGAARGAPIPFAQAAVHAGELAHFLDETLTHGVDLSLLHSLAPSGMAGHWSEVTEFLGIVAEHWPRLLAAEGAAEAAAARDARLRALARTLRENPPLTPVIAAGSTGSIPATAELLHAIAHLETGSVVLPALDRDLDDAAWDTLETQHPQYGLRQLLGHIGIAREDVAEWTPIPESYPGRRARVRFLSEALRSPPATDAWRDLLEKDGGDLAASMENFSIVEAANPREEAFIAACALREALETPGRRTALITPDRTLARRVAAELKRWDIVIDDSAGQPLAQTPPGNFLALLARAAAEDFAPVALLALLKHPLAAGGMERALFRRNVRALERACLRGIRPGKGLEGIKARLIKTHLARRDEHAPLASWFANLARVFAPFVATLEARDLSLSELAGAHAATAEALAATDTESGDTHLWRGPAGEAAAQFIASLMREGVGIAPGDARQYAGLFRDLALLAPVRPAYDLHPRLAILGPQEARLLEFDFVILSGLNEGAWPAEAAIDPWLSRPMREQLGLEAPERRIGLAAHDFASLAATPRVLMTRALKDAGAPTLASRWLLRVKQLAAGLKFDTALGANAHLLRWAHGLDYAPPERRVPRPAPRPPVSARPRALSVTEIEKWLRDPYAIYARHVLRLKPLEPLDLEPGPAERGTAIHRALERFLAAYPDAFPDDALARLIRAGEEAFQEAGAGGAILALWRPRFARAAEWFIAYERARRAGLARSIAEVKGEHAIAAPGGTFILKGRADRIDLYTDGTAAVLDYKTGAAPSSKQIGALIRPQLPLEAAMLLQGAFHGLHPGSVRDLIHIRLTGGVPPGEEHIAAFNDGANADTIAVEALEKLVRLVARYDDPATPYISRLMPFKATDKGDYDRLARLGEWMRAGEEES